MHIEFQRDDGTGRTVVQAKPSADDSPLAVDRLILDAAPRTVHHDRLAVAGTILFGAHAATGISFSKKVSHEFAELLHSTFDLEVTSKVLEPNRIAPGSDYEQADPLRVTTLTASLVTGFPECTPGVDQTRLGLVPGERFQGALYGIKEAIIASNAWLLAEVFDPASVLLATGVIYAEDFLARELRAELGDGSAGRPTEGTRQLCSVIGLDLP